ncbi:MAG TPA: hypothetical protein VLG47_02255 [Candidatus Saccharimonadales bacterium]|nr:hypothetical protein [Candidatus Saccharimonadales bacterium]
MDEPKPDAPKNENSSNESEIPPDKNVGIESSKVDENKPAEPVGENGKNETESSSDKPTDTPQKPADAEFSVKAAVSKPPKNRHKMMLILALILVIAAGIGYYFYSKSNSKPAKSVSTATPAPAPAPVQQASGGNTFYQTPKKIGDLNFFKDTSIAFGVNCTGTQTTGCPPLVAPSKLMYYQIGTTKSNQPIVVVAYDAGMIDGPIAHYAIKQANGKYLMLGKMEPGGQFDQGMTKTFNANVVADTTTAIPEFKYPTSVTIKGVSMVSYGAEKTVTGTFINGLDGLAQVGSLGQKSSQQPVKLGSQNGQDFYEVMTNDQPYYQVKMLRGAVGGVNAVWYQLKTLLENPGFAGSDTANKPVKIKWTDGQTNTTAEYGYGTGHCGDSGGYVVTKNLPENQLVKAGTAPDGTVIYQVPTTSGLFKAYYANYVSAGSTGFFVAQPDKTLYNLSATGYQNKHALIVMKNALGEYVVYARGDMTPGGGCGKPVIYLYPQKTTNVDVGVGAHITKSDPTYGPYGWQNVVAHPDGSLNYQGKTYGSLYWEGKGIGMYPLLSSGMVVPHAQVVSTIKSQLSEQGLNAHEISDFLAFWQPKLPNTPYTRLTWLGTDDMNQLAPLQITPTPQTVIRTFLDFQGLDHQLQLSPQTFKAPQRDGFTVVEWGGLLRN